MSPWISPKPTKVLTTEKTERGKIPVISSTDLARSDSSNSDANLDLLMSLLPDSVSERKEHKKTKKKVDVPLQVRLMCIMWSNDRLVLIEGEC